LVKCPNEFHEISLVPKPLIGYTFDGCISSVRLSGRSE